MKLLFDQNLSPRLVGQLAVEFPGSQHVRDAGLAAAPDPAVWAYALAQGLVIVSKDTDFQQRALLLGVQDTLCAANYFAVSVIPEFVCVSRTYDEGPACLLQTSITKKFPFTAVSP